MRSISSKGEQSAALALFAIVASYGYFSYAWITEDAFINFRVAENFFAGQGLVWNIGERVQVFTSPLWMILTLLPAAITRELFYTTIAISFVLTTLTFGLLHRTARSNTLIFLPCAALLMLAPSFRDYSSSGLETPLVALTLACFAHLFLAPKRRFRLLVLAASLCAITRHDSILLTLPFLAHAFLKSDSAEPHGRWRHKISDMLIGGLPLIAWTLFSLVYFGSPVPNTAHAKITSGTIGLNLAEQTLRYFDYMQHFDPLSVAIFGATVLLCFIFRSDARWPLLIAMGAFVAYLFHIGSDYMAGRFFLGPLVLSIFVIGDLLARNARRPEAYLSPDTRGQRPMALALLLIPNIALAATYLSSTNDSHYRRPAIVDGIADERTIYYSSTDFLTVLAIGVIHPFRSSGESVAQQVLPEHHLVVACNIGMLGYYAPRNVRIIDPIGLSDAFLSRLPPRPGEQRIGHFERFVPRQYLESLLMSENRFSDPTLAAYYDDIVEATRKPLFSWRRAEALWRLNSGHYRNHLEMTGVEDMGGAVLIDTEPQFRMHSCLGGAKVPTYIIGREELASGRVRPMKQSLNDREASAPPAHSAGH